MQRLLARPEVHHGIGHMCRFGVKTESPEGDASPMLVRKPTRWASSAKEVLKRVCLRCANESETEPACWHRH
eukprot:11348543-Alexandrium_andersonii.AAC.1